MDTTSSSNPSLLELRSDNSTADAYSPDKIQHGLCINEKGELCLRPEIEAKISDRRKDIVCQLLWSGRASEANSYAACGIVHRVWEHCPEWHQMHASTIWCGKPFLCKHCGSTKARVRDFSYNHPYLFAHLLSTQFSVLTFYIDDEPHGSSPRTNLENAQKHFVKFIEEVPAYGWLFSCAFSYEEDETCTFERTKFFAICEGKLPAWPTLNAVWKRAAGARAHLKVKLFDGRDGDLQGEGLRLAYSGFEDYHACLGDVMNGWPEVEYSEMFSHYQATMVYGSFRGFDKRIEADLAARNKLAAELGGEPSERLHEFVADQESGTICHNDSKCSDCGKVMINDPNLPLMTLDELHRKRGKIFFGHRLRPIYARYSTPRPPATTIEGNLARAGPS